MRPARVQAGAGLFPAAGMRGDLGALLTAGMFGVRAGWTFAQTGLQAGKLTGPFSDVVDKARPAPLFCALLPPRQNNRTHTRAC